MVAHPRPDDLLGGRYRLDASIASGGMADVWRGVDTVLGRPVAVKMLKATVASDPTVAERFRREARSLARLVHRNIVPVYDCIEENGQVALVMRLVEGKSLRDVLDDQARGGARGGQLSVHMTVHIGRSIAAALDKAHRENIVHRDIKPGNILMVPEGEVLLTDFGIAKPLKATDDDGTDLTRADIMMGTAKYLSPEQVQGRELDGRADMYALGLVLYECLAGDVPFRGDNDQATAVARLQRDPTPLGGLRPDIPASVVSVIHRMLRRKPEHRYETCKDVADALEQALRGFHDAATPPNGQTPPRTPDDRTTAGGRDPLMGDRPTPRPRGTQPSGDEGTPTPRGTPRTARSLPAARRTSARRGYLGVAGALLVAGIAVGLLWNGLRDGGSSGSPVEGGVGPVTVLSMKSYDPRGDDGAENEDQVPALSDDNPATMWSTVCYNNEFFGAKGKVGIALTLSGLGIGRLEAGFENTPWGAEVYTFAGEQMPTTFEDWGAPVGENYGDDPGEVVFDIESPSRFVLLAITQAGRSGTCSNNNPYRASLSRLSFVSGGG
jgi:serine/threonine-protein kinase